MIYYIIAAIIVIGIVVGLIAFIKYLIEYSFAKKVLKKYPNAPRAYFGFGYKIVTLENMSSSERRQINIHKNLNFWKAKEEETLIYINGVEDIKQQFPDGYETWCGNVNDRMKNNIEIVFKSIESSRR